MVLSNFDADTPLTADVSLAVNVSPTTDGFLTTDISLLMSRIAVEPVSSLPRAGPH